MTDLSPAAQRVLDAATAPTGDFCLENVNEIAAAALRALDEQLGYDVLGVRAVDSSQIRLIADELEGGND